MRHILSVLMENESGAMSRVVGLFSARDYNIDSLAVAPTEDKTLSRMTIVTHGDEQVIEQITKQLNKLIEVIKVVDLNEKPFCRTRIDAGKSPRRRQRPRRIFTSDRNIPWQHHRRNRPQLHH